MNQAPPTDAVPPHGAQTQCPFSTILSSGLAAAAAAAGPSIVRVDARRRTPATGVIWSADGLIVTANHVVRQDAARVGLADGEEVDAVVIGRDPSTDLAVLKVEKTGLAAASRADLDTARVGHLVLALGRPGRTVQATLGIVSALGAAWRTGGGGDVDRYLQTDVVMYPGFSGGPLVDGDGALLGINSSGLVSGVSVALPVTTVARVVEALLTHGRVRKGYLGVSTQKVALPEELRGALEQKAGLLVVMVEPQSPAHAGGVLLGDTIVELDGEPVTDHQALVGLLSGERVGQAVVMHVIRGGVATKLTVTIGERQ